MWSPVKLNVAKPALLGLWSFQFLAFMRRGVFYSFMYLYLFSLMGNVTSTAALGALTMLLSATGQNLLWGRISDRYRLRTQLIVVGEAVAGLAYLMVFLVHRQFIEGGSNIAAGLAIIVGLATLEFFWSMSDVGWAALITDITTPQTRGSFVGTLNFAKSIGRLTGIVIAGFLYEGGLGFRQGTIFYVVAIMLFLGASIMRVASKSIKPSASTSKARCMAERRHGNIGPKNLERKAAKHEKEQTFRWFLIALTIVVLGGTSVNQIFTIFLNLNEGLNASDVEISFILSAWTVGGMAASLVAGRLADKLGRTAVILAGLLMAAGTPLFYGAASNVGLMALIYGINGSAFMTIHTAGFALAGDMIPEYKRGRLLSRYNAVMALSWGPAGLLIGAPFADVQIGVFQVPRHEAYINAFVASSLLILVGATVFFMKVRKRHRFASNCHEA